MNQHPVINAYWDNWNGSAVVADANIANGGYSNDPWGEISGTSEAGATVNVYVDGNLAMTTVANASGVWRTGALPRQADGAHTITAKQVDVSGNTSALSSGYVVNVDTQSPTVALSMSDNYLVPGQTSVVTFKFTEKVTGFDLSDITAPNGAISNLASKDGGLTWTATFTPAANVNDNTNIITVGTGYTDLAGNAGAGGASANYTILTNTSGSVSLGTSETVSRTITSYQTWYRAYIDNTIAYSTERWFNNWAQGHNYFLEYKLSNNTSGKIDISDVENTTDSFKHYVYDGAADISFSAVRLWNYTCAGFWKSGLNTKNGTYTLEDDAGLLGLGVFADWHDATVHLGVESYQHAINTSVTDTRYALNFANATILANETPNACYKITLSGGSNYQLQDANGNVLMSNAGTYQATIAQIKAGLKVYVFNGGSAPTSESATFVSTASPLVLDLDGNGVQTVAVEQGAQFDLSGDGKQTVGWVDRHDGLLVMDLNHNGQVDSGAELFGNATTLANGSKASDGWLALADQDTNHDGVVDAQDAHFADLRVWVDANGDGSTDAGELRSLADVGIISLNVSHVESSTVQNGNLLDGAGSFTKADGSMGAMSDAWFQVAPPQTMDLSEVNTALENGVKTVNLADSVAQKITLNLADVLATPAQFNGQHQLVVKADAKDVVSLGNLFGDGTQGSGQWLAQGVTEVNGNAFTVYQYSADSSLQVLLDQHLASGHVQFA